MPMRTTQRAARTVRVGACVLPALGLWSMLRLSPPSPHRGGVHPKKAISGHCPIGHLLAGTSSGQRLRLGKSHHTGP